MSLLPWQDADWTRFADQFARLPHALLFTGAAGIGKDVFARHVAQALLCEHPRADQRPCCKKYASTGKSPITASTALFFNSRQASPLVLKEVILAPSIFSASMAPVVPI